MPKSNDKTKGAQKRKNSKNSSNNESDGSDTRPKTKQRKLNNCSLLEGIEMSKQLAAEMQSKKTVRRRNVRNPAKADEPRLLGNGNPMPSLAELEAMYADSEDDDNTPKQNVASETSKQPTPLSSPVLKEGVNLDSPETLIKMTTKVIDILSKKIDSLDDGPPPPVIPQKKPKKSGIPYIVGCKNRKQVPWAPKSKFGVGDEDFGIDNNPESEDECPKKRKKRGKPLNLSKSIFNAKSDEIAESLKESDTLVPRTDSPDSNSTIEYDLHNNSPLNNTVRSFSPLPSTSRDSETILRNEKLFNESLQTLSSPKDEEAQNNVSQVDIEIIEIPYETIVIDDAPNLNINSQKHHYVDLSDEDCCILDEPVIKKKKCSESPTKSPPIDDVYASIDLTETYDNEVFEINDDDIDSLIAESQAILNKNVQKSKIDSVTAVDPSAVVVGSFNITPEPSVAKESTPYENKDQIPLNSDLSMNSGTSNENVPCPVGEDYVDVETTVCNTDNNSITNQHQPAPTQDSQSTNDHEIVEVVTNFFNPQNATSHPTSTVDLTNDNNVRINNSTYEESMLSRISSWISSFESLFSGRTSSNHVAPVKVPITNRTRRRQTNNTNERVGRSASSPVKRSSTSTTLRNSNQHNTQLITNCTQCHPPSTVLQGSDQGDLPQIPASVTQPQTDKTTSSVTTALNSPPRKSLGECPICMDNMANSAVASTLCGHVFCIPCIQRAIRTNGKRCPTCRKTLKGAGYHQLFI